MLPAFAGRWENWPSVDGGINGALDESSKLDRGDNSRPYKLCISALLGDQTCAGDFRMLSRRALLSHCSCSDSTYPCYQEPPRPVQLYDPSSLSSFEAGCPFALEVAVEGKAFQNLRPAQRFESHESTHLMSHTHIALAFVCPQRNFA